MATVTITEILGGDNIAASRIVLNNNFTLLQNAINTLETRLNTSYVPGGSLNVGDVQQGTGSGSKLEAYVEAASNADVVASALTSMHMHLRARYFVITSLSTWTSTIAVMARAYGFASQVYVHDIGRNHNTFSSFARKGCDPVHGEKN